MISDSFSALKAPLKDAHDAVAPLLLLGNIALPVDGDDLHKAINHVQFDSLIAFLKQKRAYDSAQCFNLFFLRCRRGEFSMPIQDQPRPLAATSQLSSSVDEHACEVSSLFGVCP